MTTCLLLFPHQLFENVTKLYNAESLGGKTTSTIDLIALTEDPLFFGDEQYPCNFHRQKLMLHRASMREYFLELEKQEHAIHYFEYKNKQSKLSTVIDYLKNKKITNLICFKVTDFILNKRITHLCQANNINLTWLDTPIFLNTPLDNSQYRSGKKRWFMADFYQWQRKRFNILIEKNGQPKGGKWSFDEDNRKKIPKKNIKDIPALQFPESGSSINEARAYINEHCPHALGDDSNSHYPVNHKQASIWLEHFLKQRFELFGTYEDAIVEDQNWLYHSVLTPMLNIGLLTPQQVIDRTLAFAKENNTPLNSLEGFVRQIIGWREFMRATYEDLGVKMRTTNHWQHNHPMPTCFYDGSTGITPVDNTIQRLLKTGYCHHIERLMVLGGFMFLCEINPNDIYRWFMELSIDSYDWVMVPNVYAMSQNADGGLITTKPYFSGSNYIRKMSHYPTGTWSDIWDGLYWRWIFKHADALAKNPRWAMMVRTAQKMDDSKKQTHLNHAEMFLSKIHRDVSGGIEC